MFMKPHLISGVLIVGAVALFSSGARALGDRDDTYADSQNDGSSLGCSGTPDVYMWVDFANAETTKNMVGFLHSTNSPAKYVTPLKPAYWRATPGNYQRIKDMVWNAKVIQSPDSRHFNLYGEQDEIYWNLDRWSRTVADFMRYDIKGDRWNTIIDSPNEPNDKTYWPYPEGQPDANLNSFLWVYNRMSDEIRKFGTGHDIAGPNTSGFNDRWNQRLADYCRANGCEINTWTWHFGLPWDIRADAKLVKDKYIRNPYYSGLNGRDVLISEFQAPETQYDPSASLSYFYHFEKAEEQIIKGAMKGCWHHTDFKGNTIKNAKGEALYNNCYNGTLDGLLAPAGFDGRTEAKPRPIWHLWKAYADGHGSRVNAGSNSNYYPILASRKTSYSNGSITNEPQILIAYHENIWNDNLRPKKIQIEMKNLRRMDGYGNLKQVRVSIDKYPLDMNPSNGAVSTGPERKMNVAKNMYLCVNELKHRETFRIRLLR